METKPVLNVLALCVWVSDPGLLDFAPGSETRHGFEVARPRAFPAVFRKESGVDFRSRDAAELERLEACL